MKSVYFFMVSALISLTSFTAAADDYPYLTLLCTSPGYTGQFLIQFGNEKISTGEVVKAGVHNVVRGKRFLVDEAVSETTGTFGDYKTDKLILKSGGSVDWYVNMAGEDKAYLRKSAAIFGDSASLDCTSVRLTR